MLTQPRWKSGLEVRAVGDTVLVLIDEHRQIAIEGSIFVKLAPLLDGQNGFGQLAAKLGSGVSLPRIFAAINILKKRGLVAEAEELDALGRFTEYFDDGMRRKEPGPVSVGVRAIGGLDPGPLSADLAANGLTVAEDEGELLVVVTDDYLRPDLEAINAAALAAKRPWMLVKPVGTVVWVGPIFKPGETGCWACLKHRLERNRQVEAYVLGKNGGEGPIVTSLSRFPGAMGFATALAATELTKWLVAPGSSTLEGTLTTLDLRTRTTSEHTLVKRPQCKVCGDPAANRLNELGVPVALEPAIKRFREDGGHRTSTPEETYVRFKHHVSPLIGAVSELTAIPWGAASELTNTCVAGHNFSLGVENLAVLRESLRSMSGGKGASAVQSLASGLCEAIERYSGLYTGDEVTHRASYNEMKAQDALHPNDYMGFSEWQLRNRNYVTGPVSKSLLVPGPFDPDAPIDWTPAWSLTREESRWVPTALCYFGHPDFRGGWSLPCSNGCAAGNTREEAILQGFMELVERDSVGLWWYNKIQRRLVDLDSFDMSYFPAIVDFYKTLNREIWVIDITADNGITSLAAVSRRTDTEAEDIVVGFGAHFDPRIAALRAVTEVNQFLPWLPGALLKDSGRYLYPDLLARAWWRNAKIATETYLVPNDEPPMRLEDFNDPSSDDIADDIRTAVTIGKEHGFELMVVDQTRPDLGLNVVRVIAPELGHFWRRFGNKRMFETPVKMGWLDTPTREQDLNRYTIFF